jgi:hypothetical protein
MLNACESLIDSGFVTFTMAMMSKVVGVIKEVETFIKF